MTKSLTSGNPLKLIFNFSIPILLGNLIQQFYIMIDSIFIGKFVGIDAFAGITSANFLIFLIFGFAIGISTGCAIILARKFGAKSTPGMKFCVVNSLYILLIISIILTILGVFSAKWSLNLLKTPPKIMPYATIYTLINYYGTIALMAYNMFSQLLRSLGDNKAALFFLIVSSVLNIALDFLFVVIFKFGVAGAAVATITSEALSAFFCIFYMFKRYKFTRPTKRYLKLNKPFFFTQLKIGVPIAFECSVCAIGLLILQQAVNSTGQTFVAGFGIAMRIEDLLLTTFFAITTAASVFTAQNFGAKKFLRIKTGTLAALFIGIICCVIFYLIVFTSWDFLVKLFINQNTTSTNEITQIKLSSRRYIDIVLIHYPILSSLMILRGIVQSLGKTLIPVCGGFIELFARLFGAMVLSKLFHYDGICYATILAWWLAFIPIMCSYLNNVKKLIKNPNSFTNDP